MAKKEKKPKPEPKGKALGHDKEQDMTTKNQRRRPTKEQRRVEGRDMARTVLVAVHAAVEAYHHRQRWKRWLTWAAIGALAAAMAVLHGL